MQPENTQPVIRPEQIPVAPSTGGERVPVLPNPETGIETAPERREQTAEASAAAADAASGAVPLPQPVTPVATPTQVTTDDTPIAASDDDVIEKEWVDKAKQIILETKDDPHGRTNRVNKLQQDYLKKRYGKELGAAE